MVIALLNIHNDSTIDKLTAEQKGDILNELEGDDTVDGGKEFVSAHHLPANRRRICSRQ